jgi:MHS family alpha-ketoglutarate permease-like MFS transporter
MAVGYIILTGYTSINALVKSELFPAHIRALGVGLGYALANSMFGGTAPLIYQAMKARDQVPLFIGYVTVCIAISLVVYVFFLKNKASTYLDRERGDAFLPVAAAPR